MDLRTWFKHISKIALSVNVGKIFGSKCWVLASLVQRKLNMTCNESTTNEEKRNHASLSLVWTFNLISAKRRRRERQMKGLFDFATWRIYEPVGPMPIFCRLFWIDTKEKTRTLIPQKWTQWQFRPIPLNHVFELFAQRKDKKVDFGCQWPCGEAAPCTQVLSPARIDERFFICGQDSLEVLLQQTSSACACGCPYVFDELNRNMDGHVLRVEFSFQNGHKIKWASSSVLGTKYTANCR